MKIFLLSLLCGTLLALSGCGSSTVFTPEFIDPADSSAVSSPPASALPKEPSAPSSPEQPLPSGPPELSESSVKEIALTLKEDGLSPMENENGFLYGDYLLACDAAGFADAGALSYRLVQMEGDGTAVQNFNAYYQKDLREWRDSVLSAARDSASLSLEEGFPMEPYAVTLTASAFSLGGVISVTRQGRQTQGENEPFPFVMNECFEMETGRQLTLWDLFSAGKEEVQPRLLDVLERQAQDEAVMKAQGLLPDAHAQIETYFSPSDFSCGENGLQFFLFAPELLREPRMELTVLTVPYEDVSDILAYPLAQ